LHYGKGISPTRWSEYGLSGNINAVESVEDAIRNRDAKRGTVELVLPGGEIKEVYSRSAKKGSSARGRRAAPTTAERRKMGQKLQALPWSQASSLYKKAHPQYKGIGGYPMNTKLRASGARSYGVAAYNAGKLTKKDVEIIFRRTHKRYPEMGPLEGLACSGSGKRRKCRSVT